jgi:hypothetical protein
MELGSAGKKWAIYGPPIEIFFLKRALYTVVHVILICGDSLLDRPAMKDGFHIGTLSRRQLRGPLPRYNGLRSSGIRMPSSLHQHGTIQHTTLPSPTVQHAAQPTKISSAPTHLRQSEQCKIRVPGLRPRPCPISTHAPLACMAVRPIAIGDGVFE